MPKVHELIAVEDSLKASAEQRARETMMIFSTDMKTALQGQTRHYQPLDPENADWYPDEDVKLATTVMDELGSVRDTFGAWMDVSMLKELSNCDAKVDVVVDGNVLLQDMSAPALLNMESKLLSLRKVYELIPTLNPSEVWTRDDNLGGYKSDPRISIKTKKTVKTLVKYPATKEHPAQTETYNEDVKVGEWTTTIHSGAILLSEKCAILERIDKLYRAVKSARQRANEITARTGTFAEKIFDYINNGRM